MDFVSKSSDTFMFIRSFVREENNFHRYDRHPSSTSSGSSHNSGSAGGGKVKPSFTSRSSKISRVMTVPMLSINGNCNRRVSSKENQTATPRDLDVLRHRASTPIIRNARPASKRTSNRNEEWNCPASQMPRDSSTAIFLRDLKRNKPSLNHASSSEQRQVEKKWTANSLKEALNSNRPSLPSNCTASQSIPERPRITSSCDNPSNNNEEWIDSKIPTEPKKISSSLKRGIKQTGCKKKIHPVAFASTPRLMGTSPSKGIDMDTLWYKASDHDRFLNDASIRASLTDRTMKHAARNGERTYNSSTGLTAPRVLNEYLANPEEIIGVEHLLTAQKTARENLRCHHTKALLREQQHQKQEGYDLQLLAKRLRSTSAISSHMAQERASYISRMD